jgi:hypothetical protein
MMMKVNFHLPEKKTVSFLTRIASVSLSKDGMKIFKDTVLKPVGVGLQLIANGGHFIVKEGKEVSFSSVDMPSNLIVNCSTNLYIVGNLKFYAQMSGREGMSSYWCMWCQLHPSEWQTFQRNPSAVPEEKKKMWTVALHKNALEIIINGQLKEAREKKGVVGQAIWPFIEPANFIFQHIYFEIGVVNMVLVQLH